MSEPDLTACPFTGSRATGALGSRPTLEDWYPDRLKVEQLHRNPPQASAVEPDFDYAAAFQKLDLDEIKRDIKEMLHTSVDWWPSDYGNYGPQMIRMAWHAAGTYRIADGRGGIGGALQRFAPINSWEDNGNIDKSRRLLLPIKQKYGAALSWGDLIALTGNCALESMGMPTFGYGGGRLDEWEPDNATWWGPEFEMVERDERWQGRNGDDDYLLDNPMGATHQSLIYVHPEGPYKSGDPEASARDIRISFGRMAMNDEETVALIAGGHAFGKSHGAISDADQVGPPPDAAPIEAMGMGWMNPVGKGFAEYTMTNGIEGSWTPDPTQWDNSYLENLLRFEWVQTTSPNGAIQYEPADPSAPKTPDAHLEGVEHTLMMMVSDIALKVDPDYRRICEKFVDDFDAFTDAFSRAWFKLTHRDMGPKVRYLGPEVPEEDLLWQDPTPARDYDVIDDADIAALKDRILASGLAGADLIGTAWASASTYRDTDKRGGANGARIALAPQNNWEINNPPVVIRVIGALGAVMDEFNSNSDTKKVSLADLIVLGGCAAIERAAAEAGTPVTVPFTPGRVDTTAELTDEESFEWLRPRADGFRNYAEEGYAQGVPLEQLFLDRAALLNLTAPEWTALVGGLRVLDTNWDRSRTGVFTDRVGVLTNDFFTTLTSMDYRWETNDGESFDLVDRESGETAYTASRCDLVFGSNAQLRNIAEHFAAGDGHERFVTTFVAAWDKVMMADRYDVTG